MTLEHNPAPAPHAGQSLLLTISWLWVGIPLAWGIYATLMRSMALFR